jgi:hypothetical protein
MRRQRSKKSSEHYFYDEDALEEPSPSEKIRIQQRLAAMPDRELFN